MNTNGRRASSVQQADGSKFMPACALVAVECVSLHHHNPGASKSAWCHPYRARRLEGLQLLMSRQSVDEQPQTHVLTLRGGDAPAADRQLTQFPHPYPTLRGLQVRRPGIKG